MGGMQNGKIEECKDGADKLINVWMYVWVCGRNDGTMGEWRIYR